MASLQLLELEQPWDGPVRVLHLLSIAKQTDVLLEALKKCATELSWSQIPAVLAEASLYQSQTPIPLRESLVCELILNVAKTHDTFNLSGQYTTSGQEAIATLQDCIFGSNLNQSPFLQLVCCQSYEKASIARLACIKLLERAATPANCFTLLHLADHCRLPSLAAAAEAVALANFAGACELDESGFLGLPMELLSGVLSSDYLVAANELQVFGAVATWVTADKPHRLPHFHKLLVTGVRLYCMSRSELYELDTHPLTPSCPEVMKAVAFAYLELCYGGAARVTAPQRCSKQPIQFHTQPVAGRAALGSCAFPPKGAPVHQQLPQWICQPPAQPSAPECTPMDCCTAPGSPLGRMAGAAFCPTFPGNYSGTLLPESGSLGLGGDRGKSLGQDDSFASGLVQFGDLSMAAARSEQATSADTADEQFWRGAGSGMDSNPGSQGVSAAGLDAVQATPLDECPFGAEGSRAMMSPVKRKALAAPREESEAEAMQADKMPRYSSCRRLRFC